MAKKIQIIDIVRTFSILFVLILHQRDRALPPLWSWSKGLWSALASNGYYGVSLFFVVSGFLISRLIDTNLGGLAHPNVRAFYTRRVARILPLFLMIIAFGIFMGHWARNYPGMSQIIYEGPNASHDWVFWLSLPTLLFNWIMAMKQNGANGYGLHWDVLWSITIEEQFYLCYPLVLKYLGSRRRLWIFLGTVFMVGLMSQWGAYLIRPNDLFLSYMNSFTGFEEIAIGAMLYLTASQHAKFLSRRPKLCVLGCVLGLSVMLTAYFHPYGDKTLLWTPTLLDLGLFLFLLGGLHLRFFESKFLYPLSLPGKVSYGMYLWHASVLFWLLPLMPQWDTWPTFAVFASATIAVAYLSYRFFEMPMNHWVRHRLAPVSPQTR